MTSASRSLVSRFRLRELKRSLPAASPAAPSRAVQNPFVPHLNPATNCWAPPRYSLRRQADLVKRARLEGRLHLLPPGPKSVPAQAQAQAGGFDNAPADLAAPVEWLGAVKIRNPIGADVGNRLYAGKKQMFKGHKWERVRRRRRKYQRILMRDMAERILRWRRVRGTFAGTLHIFTLTVPHIAASCQEKALAIVYSACQGAGDTKTALLVAVGAKPGPFPISTCTLA